MKKRPGRPGIARWSCNCGAKGEQATFYMATLYSRMHKRKRGGPTCRRIIVRESKQSKPK